MIRVVVIGPGNAKVYYEKIVGKPDKDYNLLIEEAARVLADENVEIAVLPDRGTYLDLAIKYKEANGRKVIGLVPFDDKIWGIKHLKPQMELTVNGKPLFDEFINTGDWFKEDETEGLYGHGILILGHSPGAIRELSSAVYLYYLIAGIKKEARIQPEQISKDLVVGPDTQYFIINYLPLSRMPIYEPLKRYAELYGIKVFEVNGPQELRKVLENLQRKI